MSQIYLMRGMIDGDLCYKIGKSKDSKKRLKQLLTANPTIELIDVFEIDKNLVFKLESTLHRKYNYSNKGGEWFSDSKIIDNFRKDCEMITESFRHLSDNYFFKNK